MTLACLHGCTEVACKEAEWKNGLIVTVFWAWSAEMSWNIWEGVSGVRFCHFGQRAYFKNGLRQTSS